MIGTDTNNYVQAMHRVLRQDPDVILIGEVRDAETARAAIEAAMSGRLVLSTLHTTNAGESINRIVDFFPLSEQHQIRRLLAACLKGVISQRLLPASRWLRSGASHRGHDDDGTDRRPHCRPSNCEE